MNNIERALKQKQAPPTQSDPDLKNQSSAAELALKRYSELSKQMSTIGRFEDPEYRKLFDERKGLMKDFDTLSKKIGDQFGINLGDIWIPAPNHHQSDESILLGKMVNIAREAEAVHFDLNLDVDDLVKAADRLVKDFKAYSAPIRETGKSSDKNYSERAEAKRLLIESIARKLAQSLDVGDGREISSVQELTQKTGVDFLDVVRTVEYVSFRKKGVNRGERLPQIGATGTWETPGGYVSGKVISGRPGGPYTIETPQGKLEVQKIY